jgi:hypothetical protein
MAPFNPKGHCTFFSGLCNIHSTKPRECAFVDHTTKQKVYRKERWRIIKAWDNKQAQDMIRELLGKEPVVPTPTFLDMIGMIL